jgi:hypothetical protein
MSTPHPRPWRRDSLFGEGPRRALGREQRARFRFLLSAHRRAHRLTPTTETIGNSLVRRLGTDGRLDPSHDTIATDVGCCARTVRRALDRLKEVGLLMWQRRIVRCGWRTAQSSNAYLLLIKPAENLVPACDGQNVRQTIKKQIQSQAPLSTDVHSAVAALARRRLAVEQALLDRRLKNNGDSLPKG